MIVFILYLEIGSGNARVFQTGDLRYADWGLFGKSSDRKKGAKVKEPRSVLKAKKKQEAQDRKIKREYKKYIKWSQKRTYDIQTREVKARMRKDKRDSATRDRVKRKLFRTSSKKAGRKYK